MTPERARRQPDPPSGPTPLSAARRRRVLFVDDDDTLPALLRGIFETARVEFDFDFAGTAGGALSMMNTFCFDAVVLDYKLPDYIAGNVAAEVRAKYPSMPLAYMTNYSGDEIIEQAEAARVRLWPPKLTLIGDHAQLLALVRALVEEAPCEERRGGGGYGRPGGAELTPPHPPPGQTERRGEGGADTGHRRRQTDAGAPPVLQVRPGLTGSLRTLIRRRDSFIRG